LTFAIPQARFAPDHDPKRNGPQAASFAIRRFRCSMPERLANHHEGPRRACPAGYNRFEEFFYVTPYR
jgi:hypothetical protein